MDRSVCRASMPKYICPMNSGVKTTNRKASAQTALGEKSQLEAFCVFTWAHGPDTYTAVQIVHTLSSCPPSIPTEVTLLAFLGCSPQ